MSTISVPRNIIIRYKNPREEDLDAIRDYLLAFYNDTHYLDVDNIADGGLTYSGLDSIADDEVMKWTNSDATIKYDASNDVFEIKNTLGDIVWSRTISGDTTEEIMRLDSDTGDLTVTGTVQVNTSLGDQSVDLLWILSRYRKPKFIYVDDNIISLEANGLDNTESLLLLRDRLVTCIDRTMSLAATANGYVNTDTGAAVSGIRNGLTRTDNTWYYVYGVRVQYGTNADGNSFIMVADTTSPESTNISTLDTRYGSGAWVYLGLVRNGWNTGVAGSGAKIVPFVMECNGVTRYTTSLLTNESPGPRMVASFDTVPLTWAVAFGTGAAEIPPVVSRCIFGAYREAYGTEFHYESNATNELNAITTGTFHIFLLTTMVLALYMDVPLISGYNLIVRVANAATGQRISVAAITDHYL